MRSKTSLSSWLRKAALALLLLGLLVPMLGSAATPPPVITVQPESQSVPLLGSVTFTVGASSGTTMTYQWRKNGSNISGATRNSYTIATVQTTDAATYTAKVTNAGGSVTSDGAILTVLLPPTITTEPLSQTVAVGAIASFSVGATGTAPLSYQWNLNGTALAGATNSTLALTNVQTTDAGSYTVIVGNLAGAVNSSVATLRVMSGWVGVVVNINDSGAGSLRQAMLDANSSTLSPRTIFFNIPGAGPFTISVASPLPVISNSVSIDATTQPGFVSRPVVELNGKAGSTGNGLYVTAGGCRIEGLAIHDFPGNGIVLALGASNVIQGNFIGTGSDGATKLPNGIHGLMVSNSAWNIIGGNDGLTRNVILTSGQDGIHLEGTGANCNQVLGNFVGMDWTGLVRVGVKGSGIVVSNAAWNVIGGTNAGAGNISSWNWGDGLVIRGSNACFNLVQGNLIGTDISGTKGAGSSGNGITIQGAPSNTIGGLTLAAANVIVNHSLAGISISGLTAQYNVVQGNFIGTDRTGTLNLKNGSAGVSTTSTFNNTVGGLTPSAGNTVAFNGAGGVVVSGGQCAILGNALYSNTGNEISLLSGGNTNAVAPVLTGVTSSLSETWFRGSFTNTPATTFWVEFFASPTSVGDGKTFLGGTSVGTDGAGVALVNTVLRTGNITNQYVTATATDPAGNTSPLSVARAVAAGALTVITSQPLSQVVLLGQTAWFSVGAGGPAPFSYQWRFNGTNLAGATDATLSLNSVQMSQAGNYAVVVTNVAGSVTSAVATLRVIAAEPGSYVEAVVTNRPLAFWRLGELSGTTAFDCVGGSDATYTNATLNQAGALATDSDTAAGFNGTSSYAGTGVSLANNRAAFTIEGWIKLKAGSTRMGFWGQNDAIEFGLSSPTIFNLYTAGGGNLYVTNLNLASAWGTNSWHHVAAVGNGTNLLLYVDGSLAGSGGTATANYGSSAYPFNIGGGGIFDTTGNWFNGGLDEVAFYDRALAATDIKRHYLLGLALPTIALAAPADNATFTAPATISLAATVVTNGHTIAKVQFFNGATLLNEVLAAPYTYNWSGVGDGTYKLSAVAIYDSSSVTSAAAMLTVTAPTPPCFGAAGMSSNGFTFQLSVPVGATYVIEATTNLQDWTPIFTNVALTSSMVLTDPAATNFSRRFYRAMVQ